MKRVATCSLVCLLTRSLGERRPHAVVSSDASSDRLQTQESAEDKLIIYRHYATMIREVLLAKTILRNSSLEIQHAVVLPIIASDYHYSSSFCYYFDHHPNNKRK